MSFPKIVLPRMVEVRQKIISPKLDDFVSEIREELKKSGLHDKIRLGDEIAITAGSRGIAHIPEILRTVVDEVEELAVDHSSFLPWEVTVEQALKGRQRS